MTVRAIIDGPVRFEDLRPYCSISVVGGNGRRWPAGDVTVAACDLHRSVLAVDGVKMPLCLW